MHESDYLTLKEVSASSRMSYTKVRQLVKDGRLRAIKPGKLILVKRAELDAFLQASAIVAKVS